MMDALRGVIGISPTLMPPSGPHDIVSSVDNSAVRYKVYPDKKAKKKPVIKFCVNFDADDPQPERDWEQFRDDGDARPCG